MITESQKPQNFIDFFEAYRFNKESLRPLSYLQLLHSIYYTQEIDQNCVKQWEAHSIKK